VRIRAPFGSDVTGHNQEEEMRLVTSEFVSLDGVIEDPGGSEQTEHGGWTNPYWGDELIKFKGDELAACDGLLMGRITYEGFAAAWPSATEDEGFARMTGIPQLIGVLGYVWG
jgi:dihydrofolate reductase